MSNLSQGVHEFIPQYTEKIDLKILEISEYLGNNAEIEKKIRNILVNFSNIFILNILNIFID